jgi:hypothetical protein
MMKVEVIVIRIFVVTLLSVLICSVPFPSFSTPAHRQPHENLRQALERNLRSLPERIEMEHLASTAYGSKRSYRRLDLRKAPEFHHRYPLKKAFTDIRDLRFIEDSQVPDFLRRISWQFPDDGCFARAEMATRLLEKMGYPSPAKIFVFGELQTKTHNHPAGAVYWWYHVVPGYRVGRDLAVFDPAIRADAPMPLTEWVKKMGGDVTSFEFAICDGATYAPFSGCDGSQAQDLDTTLDDQRIFLNDEWERALELGRDPVLVLGDQPPW